MGRARKQGGPWHLFFRSPSQETMDELDLFIKLSVIRGVHHMDVLAEVIKRYNNEFLTERSQLAGIELVDENKLRAALDGQETPASRITLHKLRTDGLMADLFWSHGRRVVYNLEGCKAFFRERRAA
jgi:hypothetical protein